MDAAVILVTIAGAPACCAALTLFFGALLALFDRALLFSGEALPFVFETLLSGRSIREQAKGATDRRST